jgi:hypothetical protein
MLVIIVFHVIIDIIETQLQIYVLLAQILQTASPVILQSIVYSVFKVITKMVLGDVLNAIQTALCVRIHLIALNAITGFIYQLEYVVHAQLKDVSLATQQTIVLTAFNQCT